MKKTLLSICGAALVCGSGFHAPANTILTDAGPTADPREASSNENVGYDFTVGSTPLMITALGLWDGPKLIGGDPSGSVGDGFSSEHVIGLWDNSGNLLAKAVMQIGTGDTLIGEFRYASILIPTNPGPVILSANTTYVLGAAFLENDPDPFELNISGDQATFDPAVSPGNLRDSAGSFSFPFFNGGPGSIVGPNALFTLVSNGNGVPEGGSTLLLMGAGIAVFFVLRGCTVRRSCLCAD
jgi:hypothetical protein